MTYTVPVTKSESLTVRVSPALRAALEAEAEAGGETLTKVVQRHLTAGLAEDQGRRRELILEADMARELDNALSELVAAGTRVKKVSTRLTLNHDRDFDPFAGMAPDPDPDPES